MRCVVFLYVCMLKFIRTFVYKDINYVREKEIDCQPKNKTWEEEKSETQINNCTKLFLVTFIHANQHKSFLIKSKI